MNKHQRQNASTAWLSLGANMGDPTKQLAQALEFIDAPDNITITAKSEILINPAWGKTDQNDFHNMMIEVETDMPPLQLLDACQKIENDMGRVRGVKWGPRLIDIDIVAYGRLLMQTERLTLPHKHAHERDFVLGPLRDISPDTASWIIEIAKN